LRGTASLNRHAELVEASSSHWYGARGTGFLDELGMTRGGPVADYHVYILASESGVLYVGITNDLASRVWQHRQHHPSSFTSQYNVHQLVYFETYADPRDAIAREKQLKNWRREKKVALIKRENPEWRDLSEGWFE
jgi:putative endonuclease